MVFSRCAVEKKYTTTRLLPNSPGSHWTHSCIGLHSQHLHGMITEKDVLSSDQTYLCDLIHKGTNKSINDYCFIKPVTKDFNAKMCQWP